MGTTNAAKYDSRYHALPPSPFPPSPSYICVSRFVRSCTDFNARCVNLLIPCVVPFFSHSNHCVFFSPLLRVPRYTPFLKFPLPYRNECYRLLLIIWYLYLVSAAGLIPRFFLCYTTLQLLCYHIYCTARDRPICYNQSDQLRNQRDAFVLFIPFLSLCKHIFRARRKAGKPMIPRTMRWLWQTFSNNLVAGCSVYLLQAAVWLLLMLRYPVDGTRFSRSFTYRSPFCMLRSVSQHVKLSPPLLRS